MTPSIDIRLASMIRAMTDVIGPAIEPGNNLAREQAALMVGQLQMIAAQWRRVSPYARACLDDLRETAAGFDVQGGPLSREASRKLATTLAEDWPDPEAQYLAASRALEEMVRAIADDGAPPFAKSFEQSALQFGLRQARRDRAWFAMSGFDIDADALPSLSQLVGESPVEPARETVA
jgi:hypothetical protein